MTDRELEQLAAQAKRSRRIPQGSTCGICHTTQQVSRRSDGDFRCYSHLHSATGGVELDHFLGRSTAVEAVIPLEGNAHRRVTDLRRLIGFDDLPPADGDPLLLLAHILEGIASLLVLAAEWLVAHVMAMAAGVSSPAFPVSA